MKRKALIIFLIVLISIMISTLLALPDKKMTIKILKLYCYDTEDWASDEVRLEIEAPPYRGANKVVLRKEMDDDDVWTINKTIKYNPKDAEGMLGGGYVIIKLWDEDTPDPDDLLGESEISYNITGTHNIYFRTNAFHYRLTYNQYQGWR